MKLSNWELFYFFEEKLPYENDFQLKKILDKFTKNDFLEMPIIEELVCYKKIRLLKLLFKKGMPFSRENDDASTPLHVACGASGDLSCVKFFIENNIWTDIHKKTDKYGDTPLNLALSYGHQDIINYFKEKFGSKNTKVTIDDVNVILTRWTININLLKKLLTKQKKENIYLKSKIAQEDTSN